MTKHAECTSGSRRILVAEDVEINREILGEVLAGMGHELTFANDGAQALELVQRNRFDLVLMDVQMPVMDGLEATRRIRKLESEARNVAIVALSASVSPEEERCCREAGMNDRLAKPYDWERIEAAIARYGGTDEKLPTTTAASPPAPAPPAPANQPRSSLVNTQVLDRLQRMAGTEQAREMVRSGIDAYDAYFCLMRAPAAGPAVLAAQAHKLRGSAGTVGLTAISAIAAQIEDAVAQASPTDTLLNNLEETLTATRAELMALNVLAPVRGAEPDAVPASKDVLTVAQGRPGTQEIAMTIPFRFLVVEDHEFQRAVLTQLLARMGAQSVGTAGNGAEALLLLKDPANRVDIVISDLMMPGVDGIELIPGLKQACAPVSLIFASTNQPSLQAASAIAMARGINLLGTVVKPITAEKLAPLMRLHEASRGGD